MKRPRPELSNNRVIGLARRAVSFPLEIAATLFAWASGRLQGLKSAKTVHEEDQLRQSRARRELRGLPADHVQPPPTTTQ